MPSGRVHSAATVVLAAATAWLSARSGAPLQQAAAVSAGVLTGLVLTPDLDVDEGCYSTNIIRQTFGRTAARLWFLFWLPYSRLVPHRSYLSHMPILGTLIRLLYVTAVPLLIYLLADLPFQLPPLSPAWVWAAAGLALADILHYAMDEIF